MLGTHFHRTHQTRKSLHVPHMTHHTLAQEERPVLQTFWTGKHIGRLERACLQSYVNQGYDVHVYTYLPLDEFREHIPSHEHIHVIDARLILNEDQLFEYQGRAHQGKRSNAYSFLPFADLFRFTMLHKLGGNWMDLDIFLLKPIPAAIWNRDYVFSSERTIQKGAYKQKTPEIVDMGFIKVPGPGSELTTWILAHIPEKLLDLKTPFDYMNLYRKGIAACKLEKFVLPAKAFLPLNWWDVKEAFTTRGGSDNACYPSKYGVGGFCVRALRSPNVLGVHWFRAILRKRGLPYNTLKNRVTATSLYETLIQKIEDEGGLPRNSI